MKRIIKALHNAEGPMWPTFKFENKKTPQHLSSDFKLNSAWSRLF